MVTDGLGFTELHTGWFSTHFKYPFSAPALWELNSCKTCTIALSPVLPFVFTDKAAGRALRYQPCCRCTAAKLLAHSVADDNVTNTVKNWGHWKVVTLKWVRFAPGVLREDLFPVSHSVLLKKVRLAAAGCAVTSFGRGGAWRGRPWGESVTPVRKE